MPPTSRAAALYAGGGGGAGAFLRVVPFFCVVAIVYLT